MEAGIARRVEVIPSQDAHRTATVSKAGPGAELTLVSPVAMASLKDLVIRMLLRSFKDLKIF